VGFNALTRLDVAQNAITGVLPANLALLPLAPSVQLSVYDNLLSGTLPSSYASLSWVALAYNPQLVGPLPIAFAAVKTKLYAWSAYYGTHSPAANALTSGTYGAALSYGTGVLYGTSIGLDRPLVSILRDVQAALDPSGAVLKSWGAAHWQPCAPWVSSNGANPNQNVSTPGYGRSWSGVTCSEWDALPISATSELGGASALTLTSVGLAGSLPVQLRELRTAGTIALTRNLLSGSVPSCWCVRVLCFGQIAAFVGRQALCAAVCAQRSRLMLPCACIACAGARLSHGRTSTPPWASMP
jgi:hypothetical protein